MQRGFSATAKKHGHDQGYEGEAHTAEKPGPVAVKQGALKLFDEGVSEVGDRLGEGGVIGLLDLQLLAVAEEGVEDFLFARRRLVG